MKRDASLIRLSRDHHRGLVWAMRIERELPTASDDVAQAMYAELLEFWETGLLPHFRAECECLLARLVRRVDADDRSSLADRTLRDHLKINSLMVEARDSADLDLRRKVLNAVGALLKEHIRWEESVLFEAVQRELPPSQLAALGADIAERIPEMPPPPPWHSSGS